MAGFHIDYQLVTAALVAGLMVQPDCKDIPNPLNVISKTRWPSG